MQLKVLCNLQTSDFIFIYYLFTAKCNFHTCLMLIKINYNKPFYRPQFKNSKTSVTKEMQEPFQKNLKGHSYSCLSRINSARGSGTSVVQKPAIKLYKFESAALVIYIIS